MKRGRKELPANSHLRAGGLHSYRVFNGDIVREKRLERRMTISDLAVISHVSAGYLSRLERNFTRSPSMEIVANLAEALDLPESSLWLPATDTGDTLTPAVRSPDQINLIINSLSTEEAVAELQAWRSVCSNYLALLDLKIEQLQNRSP